MFRKMTRERQALSREACTALLNSELRGVLSLLGDDGWPYGLPINHFYNEEDGCLYFHSGKKGHKIDAMTRCSKASYCVFDQGFRKPGDWALNIRSVIVFGWLEIVEDPEKAIDICRKLSYRFTDDDGYIDDEIRRSGPGVLVFRLIPEYMTGKQVNEK